MVVVSITLLLCTKIQKNKRLVDIEQAIAVEC